MDVRVNCVEKLESGFFSESRSALEHRISQIGRRNLFTILVCEQYGKNLEIYGELEMLEVF